MIDLQINAALDHNSVEIETTFSKSLDLVQILAENYFIENRDIPEIKSLLNHSLTSFNYSVNLYVAYDDILGRTGVQYDLQGDLELFWDEDTTEEYRNQFTTWYYEVSQTQVPLLTEPFRNIVNNEGLLFITAAAPIFSASGNFSLSFK